MLVKWTCSKFGRSLSLSSDSSLSSVAVPGSSSEEEYCGRVIVYVGMRLTKLPRFGTKREFWTLVRVESAETSGSRFGQVRNMVLGLHLISMLTDHVQHIDHVRSILILALLLLLRAQSWCSPCHCSCTVPTKAIHRSLTASSKPARSHWGGRDLALLQVRLVTVGPSPSRQYCRWRRGCRTLV